MKAFVFLPGRKKNGVLVKSRLWRGRYRIDGMTHDVEVPLHTPDELVARKRLNDLIIRLQREKEGLIAPAAQQAAATAPLPQLVASYAADLLAQARTPQHVKDSRRRLERMIRETRWQTVRDITPARFTRWRSAAAPKMSAKTLKEYQISLGAFLNWLVSNEQLDRNPLKRIKMPDTRGREVRRRRALTVEELRRLLAVSEHRRFAYLFLIHTGARYREGWRLLWRNVHLDHMHGPHVLLVASDTKDREARAIPLHPELEAALRDLNAMRSKRDTDDARVFRAIYPAQKDTLDKDLDAAGIPKETDAGRIDWHAFRKTWQTLAARSGVPLVIAQRILGHSDPSLTANAYTDPASLGMQNEVVKLPWIAPVSAAVAHPPPHSQPHQPLKLTMVDPTGLEAGREAESEKAEVKKGETTPPPSAPLPPCAS